MVVEPDKPVISVDASMLEQLPDDVRQALELVYDEQERKRARAFNEEQRAYQTEQAVSLVEADGSWVEVELDEDSVSVEAGEWDVIYNAIAKDERAGLYPVYDDEGELVPPEMVGIPELSAPSIHQFYHDLYGASGVELFDPDERRCSILVNHRDRKHPYQLYDDYWEFIGGVKPETSFIYMGSFWQPPSGFLIAKRNAMKTIGGFCVDIDRFEDEKGLYFDAGWVMRTLVEVFAETPELEPNYLMLSGTGIQLWYVFGEQIPLLSAKKSPRRGKYERLLRLLYRWFDDRLPKNRFKVDVPCASISHAFRAPGSPSKHHYPTRLFAKNGRERKMINPLDLSHFLGGELMPYDLEDWNQEAYARLREEAGARDWKLEPATEKQIAYIAKLDAWHCVEESISDGLTKGEADQIIQKAEIVSTRRTQYKQTEGGWIKTSEGHLVKRKPRDKKLYKRTLERMWAETPAGSRYNAMFGLAGLAWNCEIPRSRVKQDLIDLLDTDWARMLGHDGKPLELGDVIAALKGYHPLGALRSRDQLESRLKWKYEPPAKRNGRKRAEHLAQVARPIRKAYIEAGRTDVVGGGRPAKANEVREYADNHPEANHSEIARALGVSRPTVIKWLKSDDEASGLA